jgi:Tol biopolymer transport system component
MAGSSSFEASPRTSWRTTSTENYDLFVRDRAAGVTECITVDPARTPGNGRSYAEASLSADGRLCVFYSWASNLVPADNNGVVDVFVRDLTTRQTARASVDSAGVEGNYDSQYATISADGRFVAFASFASNLSAGDTNGVGDIFLRDLVLGVTQRVSLGAGGAQPNGYCTKPSVSGDGARVAFASAATNLVTGDTNATQDVFLWDRSVPNLQRLSVSASGAQGNDYSGSPSISANGRFVLFDSSASNLITGDSNFESDAFVRDLEMQSTERVSVTWTGGSLSDHSSGRAISSDGRFVVFTTSAPSVTGEFPPIYYHVYLRDRWGLTPTPYCTGTTNSAGCTPRIYSVGTPSRSVHSGFHIRADNVLERRVGMLFYGATGARAEPFLGGTLCVAPPMHRTAGQVARVGSGAPCGGLYSIDFNQVIGTHLNTSYFDYGFHVWAQYWMRDPASPSGAALTEGLVFAVGL